MSQSVLPISTYPAPGTIKLAVSVCSNRMMEPRCMIAFSMLVHHLTAFQVPFGVFCRLQASLLPQARQECLNEAIAEACTHQLWLDDDMEPPGDSVLRMLHAMKERPEIDVIAVNYPRKQDELKYTAVGLDGEMVESDGKIGLEEVDNVGMGMMMVRLDKLRNIHAPHFEVLWDREFQHYRGEDRYFSKKLREHGCRIFVDHGISNFCQHWGSIPYSFRMFNKKD